MTENEYGKYRYRIITLELRNNGIIVNLKKIFFLERKYWLSC